MADVEVTIRVRVDGEEKTFTATALTDGSGWRMASSLSHGVRNDVGAWLMERDSHDRTGALR